MVDAVKDLIKSADDMDYVKDLPQSYLLAGGAVAVTTAALLAKVAFKNSSGPPKIYPKDTVILHQIGRGPQAPSLSCFPIKLETYLRMAKIPYQNEHSYKMSPKGKTPWITLNGEVLGDSQLIIEHLNKEFNVDLNKHLSPEDKAVARAFLKLTEENLYWTIALQRWVYESTEFLSKECKCPYLFIWRTRRAIKQSTHGHGIGRHSENDVLSIMDKDMRALSHFLGDKKYFFGDEPSEVDCAIFGMLAQILWHMAGSPHETLMKGELTNLVEFCETMRQAFWPDWDDCNTKGGTVEAKA